MKNVFLHVIISLKKSIRSKHIKNNFISIHKEVFGLDLHLLGACLWGAICKAMQNQSLHHFFPLTTVFSCLLRKLTRIG